MGQPKQLPIPKPKNKETAMQKGDRLVENMKRYDALCEDDRALTCGVYPFADWGF